MYIEKLKKMRRDWQLNILTVKKKNQGSKDFLMVQRNIVTQNKMMHMLLNVPGGDNLTHKTIKESYKNQVFRYEIITFGII